MSACKRMITSMLFHHYPRLIGVSSVKRRQFSGCTDPCPKQKLMDIKCKTALITGGTTGIGLAIADSLLACGLQKAVISGVDEAAGRDALHYLIKQHGQGRAEFKPLDVRNHKQFEDVFKDIIHKEGSLDILVNNAGMLQDFRWEETIDVNVKGVIKGVLLANKYMPKQKNKGGCVVNVASILGFDTFPYSPVYGCTKHAVVGLTKSFGQPAQFSKTGVRQVALCPGVTVTPLVMDSKGHDFLSEDMGKGAIAALMNMPRQNTSSCGKGVVHMVEYGPAGSLWIVENSILALAHTPDRKAYKKKVLDL